MGEREPMTKTMKASDARQRFSQLLNQVFRGESRILVEKSGIPVAAIVSAADLERLRQMEMEGEEAKALARMRSAFAGRTEQQIVQDVARVVEEVRAERRQGVSPQP